jgi:hypothetical protein
MRRCSLLVLLTVLAGCAGSGSPSPPVTLPPGAIAGLASRERALPAPVLAAEGLDHARLTQLLQEAGYAAGAEREFYGRARPYSHVVARTLRFRHAQGATRFLSWVRAHAADTLGAARTTHALTIGDGGTVVRARGCGCHGETPTFLASWRHGTLVLWLLASGPGANEHRVAALAARLDRLAQPA